MSKCHPNKKKLRRKLQIEHNKEVKELKRTADLARGSALLFSKRKNELEAEVEELRLALRELGNNHELKYAVGPTKDGTLVSFCRVNAKDLEFKVAGRTKDEVEQTLVGKLAKALIAKGLVRIEQEEHRSYEDMQRGNVTFHARIDVIPWYKCVKPQVVQLDSDLSKLVFREESEQE